MAAVPKNVKISKHRPMGHIAPLRTCISPHWNKTLKSHCGPDIGVMVWTNFEFTWGCLHILILKSAFLFEKKLFVDRSNVNLQTTNLTHPGSSDHGVEYILNEHTVELYFDKVYP